MKTSQDVDMWQEHINKAEGFSGSQAQYCREVGISKSQFGYWKTRLNQDKVKSQGSVDLKSRLSKFLAVEVSSIKGRNLPEAKWVAEFLHHFLGGFK